MLLIGILFIVMGLIFILTEAFEIYRENDEIVIKRKKVDIESWFVRYKLLVGLLSTVLGLFSIINYIVY
ncbi:MAG TPA: hypothetical protein GXX53_03610 [Tissierellia bacterium]|nr:hypothetical protein [Tissierellia bacterium]